MEKSVEKEKVWGGERGRGRRRWGEDATNQVMVETSRRLSASGGATGRETESDSEQDQIVAFMISTGRETLLPASSLAPVQTLSALPRRFYAAKTRPGCGWP